MFDPFYLIYGVNNIKLIPHRHLGPPGVSLVVLLVPFARELSQKITRKIDLMCNRGVWRDCSDVSQGSLKGLPPIDKKNFIHSYRDFARGFQECSKNTILWDSFGILGYSRGFPGYIRKCTRFLRCQALLPVVKVFERSTGRQFYNPYL